MTYTSKIKGYKEWLSHTRFALLGYCRKISIFILISQRGLDIIPRIK